LDEKPQEMAALSSQRWVSGQIRVPDRTATWTAPFFPSSDLPDILAKIKAVDGEEPGQQAFVDRYNLTAEERILWNRHLSGIWERLETEYLYDRPSEALGLLMQGLLATPDNQLFWENPQGIFAAEFVSYVEGVR